MAKRDPNQIYIRRIATNHDLTHEINIGKPALNTFFEGNLHPVFHSKKNPSKKYQIDINSFDDDPRFGKQVYDFLNDEGGVVIGDLFVVYKANKQDYFAEIIKAADKDFSFYNHFYDNADSNERHTFVYADEQQDLFEAAEQESNEYIKNFNQIIYYGVPGSGKSNTIDIKIENIPDDQKIRVVFHPEYTNADFVGQILPDNSNNGISYKFKPGPFSKILRRAYLNPSKKYYLVIEEINRGNAAAIFGDIFQLLDRINDDRKIKTNGYTYSKGWSRYSIENDFINWYIRENIVNPPLTNNLIEDNGIATAKKDNEHHTIEIGNFHFNALTGIRLPPNLAIYATMNTSDQNVFTLDNAFQRRWDMQLVQNECSDSNQMNSTITVNNKFITWKDFQEQINKVIGEKSNESGLSSMEDKRLGCWFVKAENNTISRETFANKVLKYLWDDAFKFYHTEVFKEGIKNFEDLQKEFLIIGFDVFDDICGLKDKIKTIDGSITSDTLANPE